MSDELTDRLRDLFVSLDNKPRERVLVHRALKLLEDENRRWVRTVRTVAFVGGLLAGIALVMGAQWITGSLPGSCVEVVVPPQRGEP